MSAGNGASALVPAVSAALLRPVANPAELVAAHREATDVIAKVLEPGRDFGSVPGTADRQVLMKAGAERLLVSFGCYALATIVEHEADHTLLVRYRLSKWVDKPQPSRDEQARLKASGVGRNKKFGERWVWQEAEVEEGEAFGVYRYVVRTDIIHRASGQVVPSPPRTPRQRGRSTLSPRTRLWSSLGKESKGNSLTSSGSDGLWLEVGAAIRMGVSRPSKNHSSAIPQSWAMRLTVAVGG